MLRKYVSDVTGDTSFTLGHPSGILALLSGFVASKLGNKEKSSEDLKLPAGLSFFREISITGGIVIFIMFLVVGLIIPEGFADLDQNLFMYAITQGFTFGAVLIGFITAMVTSTLLVLISNYFNVFNVLLIPLVITSFFECGAAAVIGEGQGGLRGAIIGTMTAAILMVALAGVSAVIYSNTIQNWILIFGGNDLSLFGIIAKLIASLFGGLF